MFVMFVIMKCCHKIHTMLIVVFTKILMIFIYIITTHDTEVKLLQKEIKKS